MKKSDRQAVYNKFGGRCAYCGRDIAYKDMQVDHIKPKRSGGTDDMSNLFPACRICNHYKRDNRLETFRKWISEIPRKLGEREYIFKVGLAYGFWSDKERNVQFYFEKQNPIIHCSECKWFEQEDNYQGWCNNGDGKNRFVDETDYCSWGDKNVEV